jgi:hypothetical protein
MAKYRFIIYYNEGSVTTTNSMEFKSTKKAQKYADILRKNPDAKSVTVEREAHLMCWWVPCLTVPEKKEKDLIKIKEAKKGKKA